MASEVSRPAPRRARHAFALLIAVAALGRAPAAFADEPSAADKETARSLMDQGDERMDHKDYAAAVKAYQAADTIMHLPMTGIALAQAQVAAGLLTEARDTAIQVTHLPRGPRETAAYAKARAEAEDLADKLAARIPSVQVTVKGAPADVVIAVDGAALPAAAATLPRKVNPGKHVITANATGYEEARVEVTVSEGATVPVTLEPKRSATAIANPPGGSGPGKGTGTKGPAVPSRGASPLAIAGFGVAGAGIIAGAITGAMSFSRTSTLKDKCTGGVCGSALHGDLATANTLANVSNVAFGVGLAGAAAGIIGVLIPRPKEKEPAPVTPVVGLGSIGVLGTF